MEQPRVGFYMGEACSCSHIAGQDHGSKLTLTHFNPDDSLYHLDKPGKGLIGISSWVEKACFGEKDSRIGFMFRAELS